ncbi:predicted protein [Sclerotinia sclerotiorum 1980 UF-70]|uniref:Uncharacterized protein n=1 Tax=Sclerotinia sclerotiorum (strain ATCC 18683 / 1980 / Ss-1) TaxID=665079 RepID=A7EU46_SCLS1|nr:predicted protein [Sclerotinia sclerotiorum 1980 UF-70]EDN92988.1 predicted protein [Sclerotinia sclerotiorum 1980 UF-70]
MVKAKEIESTDIRDNIDVLLDLVNDDDVEMLDIHVDYTIIPQICFV